MSHNFCCFVAGKFYTSAGFLVRILLCVFSLAKRSGCDLEWKQLLFHERAIVLRV